MSDEDIAEITAIVTREKEQVTVQRVCNCVCVIVPSFCVHVCALLYVLTTADAEKRSHS